MRCIATLDVNFVICVVGAILSFAPMMIGVNDCRENREILDSLRASRFYRDASLATFMITIPSAVDAIIDVVQAFVAYASKKILKPTVLTSVKHISAKTTAVRLSPMERLGFTVGVASLCAFSLSPSLDTEFDGVSLALYYSITNFNTICTMCPLVFFLKRCTKLWTPFRSFLVIFLINFGSVVSAVSYSFPINSPSYFILCMTAATCIGSATFIMVFICWIFIRQFMTSNYRIKKSDFANESWGSFICQTMRQSKKYGKFYNNYVPVMHTIALLTFSLTNVAWYFILTDIVYITTMFTILQFIAAIILFVVEIRIRQSEVQRGLVSTFILISDFTDFKISFHKIVFSSKIEDYTSNMNGPLYSFVDFFNLRICWTRNDLSYVTYPMKSVRHLVQVREHYYFFFT